MCVFVRVKLRPITSHRSLRLQAMAASLEACGLVLRMDGEMVGVTLEPCPLCCSFLKNATCGFQKGVPLLLNLVSWDTALLMADLVDW